MEEAHTPAPENEHIGTPGSYGTPGPSSSAHILQPGAQNQGALSQQKFSNGPHIRSRITVVCAECKRLKLKCDRRTPCSSCVKRDTVVRCVYSQAAAEKIDVQSLHNRLLTVETTLAQLTSSSPSQPVQPFKSSYPTPTPFTQTSSSCLTQTTTPHGARSNTGSSLADLPCNDHALLVTGASGSSVVVSLDDVASIWLSEVELNTLPLSSASSQSGPTRPSISRNTSTAGAPQVKLEPTPVLLPPMSSRSSNSSASDSSSCSQVAGDITIISPVSHTVFLPKSSGTATSPSQTLSSPFSSIPEPPFRSFSPSEPPQVTQTLLAYLPPPQLRARYVRSLADMMALHPWCSMHDFDRRINAMFAWGEDGKKDLAREFFLTSRKTSSKERASPAFPKPTLSFFAAVCAALALGALSLGEQYEHPSIPTMHDRRTSPAELFALSEQALGLFEKSSPYDSDSVMAMLLQVLYQLHDGQMRIAQVVFPLIGKMVNVARMMGLAMDPDEFSGTYGLFDAEMRRRLWWSVYYYDLLVSDYMGQQPLIPENSFTTRLPSEVDDENFSSSSTTLPVAFNNEDTGKSISYFILKCRLAQLVKTVRKQTTKELGEEFFELSLDQSATFEQDIASWVAELPSQYRLDVDVSQPIPTNIPVAPILIAQRCDLAIAANRLVLKLYLPFLRDITSAGVSKPSHQAILGTINAAHVIIYASRLLHSLWRHSRPVTFDFYDFGRTLFDAAVVCAHAVIQQPSSVLAEEAMKGVNGAMDVLKDISASKTQSEAVKILQLMKSRAEQARALSSGEPITTGIKRKRSEPADLLPSTLCAGSQLPFVGPSVSLCQSNAPMPLARIATSFRKESEPKPAKIHKEKEKEKTKHPSVGIRVRPVQVAPNSAVHVRSVVPNPTTQTTTTDRIDSLSSSSGSQSASPPEQSNHSTPSSDSLLVPPSYPYTQPQAHTQSALQPPTTPASVSVDTFPVEFGSRPESRTLSGASFQSQQAPPFSASPHTHTSVYDNGSPYVPSPATYSTRQDYWGYPSAGQQTYDQSQAHDMSLGYAVHPGTPVDARTGVMSSSIPDMSREQNFSFADKTMSSFDPRASKTSIHVNPGYGVASHSLMMDSNMEGWSQTASDMARAGMWGGYKMYPPP